MKTVFGDKLCHLTVHTTDRTTHQYKERYQDWSGKVNMILSARENRKSCGP